MSDAAKSPLRVAREDAGMSREEVAAHLIVSSKTIERWEKNGGPTRYRRRYLRLLAELYEVDVAELEVAA